MRYEINMRYEDNFIICEGKESKIAKEIAEEINNSMTNSVNFKKMGCTGNDYKILINEMAKYGYFKRKPEEKSEEKEIEPEYDILGNILL